MENADPLETMEYRQFEQNFRASLQLKDRASLASALRLRQQATEVVRDIPALYCVGKHHEMILEYNHIGQGIEARQSGLESLKHEEEFKNISRVLYPLFRSNFYQESVDYMACASTSYEEGLYFFAKLKEQFPTEVSRRRYEEFKGLQSKYGRWFSTHRAILGTFYSRASAEMDKGRYAGGLAVLDVILSNAQKAGYNLDYEEYVDLLDDMCALAVRLLMQKAERRPPARSASEEVSELGCILKKPMMYWAEFSPDCLPKDKNLFRNHYKSFAMVPWIDAMPKWQELTRFWADAPSHREEGAPKLDRLGVRGGGVIHEVPNSSGSRVIRGVVGPPLALVTVAAMSLLGGQLVRLIAYGYSLTGRSGLAGLLAILCFLAGPVGLLFATTNAIRPVVTGVLHTRWSGALGAAAWIGLLVGLWPLYGDARRAVELFKLAHSLAPIAARAMARNNLEPFLALPYVAMMPIAGLSMFGAGTAKPDTREATPAGLR